MPTINDDKIAFSTRLKLALKRSRKRVESPADLALEFNLRHPNAPITPQAAHKWLNGKARPSQDKLSTLASWLNVPEQWLRYGIQESRSAKTPKSSSKATGMNPLVPTVGELKILQRIRNLPESRRQLVIEVIEEFSIDQEIWN